MPEKQTILELYKILLQDLEEKGLDDFYDGLCVVIGRLCRFNKISEDEFWKLKSDLKTRLPPKKLGSYCWEKRELKPRIEFVKGVIKQSR